jgi:hypothetical protein
MTDRKFHLTRDEAELLANAITDADLLRTVFGRPGRTLPKRFYELVANEYQQLVETTTAPGTALAAAHNVTQSASSRWMTEARALGLLNGVQRKKRTGFGST